jgi:hypothetical protein
MEKRQRQGKEREIMVGELIESMECVKKYYLNANQIRKKISISQEAWTRSFSINGLLESERFPPS